MSHATSNGYKPTPMWKEDFALGLVFLILAAAWLTMIHAAQGLVTGTVYWSMMVVWVGLSTWLFVKSHRNYIPKSTACLACGMPYVAGETFVEIQLETLICEECVFKLPNLAEPMGDVSIVAQKQQVDDPNPFAPPNTAFDKIGCNFCGAAHVAIHRLGPNDQVNICTTCILECKRLVESETESAQHLSSKK